jgi:hypothetical protein
LPEIVVVPPDPLLEPLDAVIPPEPDDDDEPDALPVEPPLPPAAVPPPFEFPEEFELLPWWSP